VGVKIRPPTPRSFGTDLPQNGLRRLDMDIFYGLDRGKEMHTEASSMAVVHRQQKGKGR